jgi:hypothetical protein
MSLTTDRRPVVHRAARAGLWLLPVYGVLLGLSTLTHQPSTDEFDAYARYITTDVFLISHIGASIFGAGLAVLGTVAVTVYLVRGRAPALAVVGLVMTTITNVFMASAFGSAAFVQPGIGRAHLNGVEGMAALNADTAYGPALVATAATSTLFFAISGIVMGTAIARADARVRWEGIAYAVFVPGFAVSGFLLHTAQPLTGFALAAATAVLAVRLPRIWATTGVHPSRTRDSATRIPA